MSVINQPIRLGMVGGGQGAFIGAVHRIASRMDGQYQLVAGALSSNPDRARASGEELGFEPDRIYTDFNEMADKEANRPDGIEAVAIVTPNHMHFAPVKAFLEAGIHVICDKPLTATLEEAQALAQIKPANNARFLLTHNYTGYPMIRLAREMVAVGKIGKIRLVQVEYLQDWLAEDVSNKQADWRTDPACSGAGGAIGDIGTHAYNLLRFVTDLIPAQISAELDNFVPGRKLDDNAHMMLRFEGGAKGMLWASQVATGCENDLSIRIYGDKGGLEWSQKDCNSLWFTELDQPRQQLRRGGPAPIDFEWPIRVPPGHPEGYLEAFANLYQDFARILYGEQGYTVVPGMSDGLEGLIFIQAAVRSSQNNGIWQDLNILEEPFTSF
ncbi:MAG TPA: oxidoreductase [Rhizobiales bacterium]|nr:oxidoreductase [Hyphomicrobiales bacterium]